MILLSKPVAGGGPFNFGYNTPGGSSGGFSGLTAVQAALAQIGTVQSISMPVLAGPSGHLTLGIYTDNGSNVPNALVAATAPALAVGGVNSLAPLRSAVLTPGTYWIAVLTEAAGIGGYYDAAPAGAWNNGQGWNAGVLPAAWPVASTGNLQFTLYATLNPAIVTNTFWLDTDGPSNFTVGSGGLNLGLEFYVTSACNLLGLRFYKNSSSNQSHSGRLYNAPGGSLIATIPSFATETASGWQNKYFASPIPLVANTHYIASIYSSDSYYCYTNNSSYFASPVTKGKIVGVQQWYDFNNAPDNPTNNVGYPYYTDVITD